MALGRSWTISGMTSGLTNLANTVAFVRFDELANAIKAPRTASYVLVRTESSADATAERIEQTTGLSALSRARFSEEEADLAKDMMARIIQVMNVSAFLIGLAVVCLTLYVATLARLRDVGIMRALGAGRRRLVAIVLSQAAWTVVLACALAVLLALVLGGVLDRIGSNVSLVLNASTVIRVGIEATALGLAGALFPLFKTWRVDPATVFRRST